MVGALKWYIDFTDRQSTWDLVNTLGFESRNQVIKSFQRAARRGTLRGRRLKWMVLIDSATTQREAIACYGDPPAHAFPGLAATHVIPATVERYPLVSPPRPPLDRSDGRSG